MRLALAALIALATCAVAGGTENRLIRTECDGKTCRKVYVGSAWENRVVDIVNRERRSRGLRPLRVSLKLMDSARAWSGQQAQVRRMYHSSGLGVGENVAWNQKSPEAVMHAWMNSPGHRRNILNPSYSEIGVGAVVSNGPYWTQHFK
jgi:uncharacterized protein YkwD